MHLKVWCYPKYFFTLSKIPNEVVREFQNIRKQFLLEIVNLKIKHETLSKNYRDGGSKNVDIHQKYSMFMDKNVAR